MGKLYRLTESQLQMIYERKLLSEMDNHNYPAGSDTPAAPWNSDDREISSPITVSSQHFKLLMFEGYEYLLSNTAKNDLFYTVGDAFDGDIYNGLRDFLNIPQEPHSDEDGSRMSDAENWEDSITEEDLAKAVETYTNYVYERNKLTATSNIQEWENGQDQYLLINKESLATQDLPSVIMSQNILDTVMKVANVN